MLRGAWAQRVDNVWTIGNFDVEIKIVPAPFWGPVEKGLPISRIIPK